jgi:hypothetical protein
MQVRGLRVVTSNGARGCRVLLSSHHPDRTLPFARAAGDELPEQRHKYTSLWILGQSSLVSQTLSL